MFVYSGGKRERRNHEWYVKARKFMISGFTNPETTRDGLIEEVNKRFADVLQGRRVFITYTQIKTQEEKDKEAAEKAEAAAAAGEKKEGEDAAAGMVTVSFHSVDF